MQVNQQRIVLFSGKPFTLERILVNGLSGLREVPQKNHKLLKTGSLGCFLSRKLRRFFLIKLFQKNHMNFIQNALRSKSPKQKYWGQACLYYLLPPRPVFVEGVPLFSKGFPLHAVQSYFELGTNNKQHSTQKANQL